MKHPVFDTIAVAGLAILTLGGLAAAQDQISGRVELDDGAPAYGMAVVFYRMEDGGDVPIVYTDSAGGYAIRGLAAGNYVVHADAWLNAYQSNDVYRRWRPEYYRDAFFYSDATVLQVPPPSGAHTNVDFRLESWAVLSGTVRSQASGQPIAGVRVSATGGNFGGRFRQETGADGTYELYVGAGEWRVYADAEGLGYASRYYDGRAAAEDADGVEVELSEERGGIDFSLPTVTYGTISGRVRTPDGSPLSGAWVYASSQYATSRSDGTYTITQVTPSASGYAIRCFHDGYPEQYYCGQAAQNTAHRVPVAAGQNVEGIDFRLWAPASISGVVTNQSGEPLEGMPIRCASRAGGQGSAAALADGSYVIENLPPGEYWVYIDIESAPSALRDYLAEYYADRPNHAESDRVVVAEGATVSEIDFGLALGGRISGQIRKQMQALAWPVGEDSLWNTYNAYASYSSAAYTITGLPPGEYLVTGRHTDYICGWYSNKNARAQADVVTVTAGEETSGIDVPVTYRRLVSGRVTGAGGAGLEGVKVYGLTPAGDFVGDDWTDSNGNYTIQALPPGTYVLWATPGWGNQEYGTSYAARFYGGSTTLGGADQITVVEGEDQSNLNISLATVGGRIRGRVTRGYDETPLVDLSVYAYPVGAPGEMVCIAYTDAGGDYVLRGLNPGDYEVMTGSADYGYDEQWYDTQSNRAGADAVTVGSGEVGGIDFALLELRPTGYVSSMTHPVCATDESPVAFRWTDGAGARLYELRVDDDTDGVEGVLRAAGIAGLAYTSSVPLEVGHEYTARVRGGNSGGYGDWGPATPFDYLAPPRHALTVEVQGPGQVTMDPPGGSYEAGAVVELTAVAESGAAFDHWAGVDAGLFQPTAVVTMQTDRVVTAWFVSGNQAPYPPVCLAPANGAAQASIQPWLRAGPFADPDETDAHAASHWQVAPAGDGFAAPVFSFEGPPATDQQVPLGILAYADYAWRARYQDTQGAWSAWSEPAYFTTSVTMDGIAPAPGAGLTLAWPSQSGYVYSLYRTANLDDIVWDPVPGYQDLPGTDGLINYEEPAEMTGPAYYRVEMTSPAAAGPAALPRLFPDPR